MYDKLNIPENVRHVCKNLQLPWNFCQPLSPDRTVCLVNDEWMKSLHTGCIVPVLATEDLDTCQVERFLSRSCDKIPHPWMKVTVKTIAKSDTLYHELPGQHLQKQWSCGSLFEFMSHITKENMTNLWTRAQILQGHTHQHSGARSDSCLPFTDVVKELLRRLKPLAYISLLTEKDSSSDKHRQFLASSDTRPVSSNTSDTRSFSSNTSDTRPVSSNTSDTRPVSSNTSDTRPISSNTSDTRSFSSNTSDTRSFSSNTSDTRPLSSNTSDTKSSNSFSTGSSNRTGSFYTTSDTQSCHGIVPVDVIIKSQNYLYIVQPYYPFTLQDVATYSPTILETSHAKPLFIIYQLLCAMHALHNHGLRMGDIRIGDIVMNKNMWLRIVSPRLNSLKVYVAPAHTTKSDSFLISDGSPGSMQENSSLPAPPDVQSFLSEQPCGGSTNSERFYEAACGFMKAEQFKYYEISMLDSIVEAWVYRHITNFEYLMILNHLAGRRMGDPNNHPVLPWVLDFSAPDSGYRDLTKSKFRLNKGDGQLDFMYSGMHEVSDSGAHVPHHVSDILSDITYYVYKARRTPKHILCAHVRSNWVPHEYPVSMQRLQDWTPDECIPEFFTDPGIFESIHEDLPDLEIPAWSKNTVDFVVRHLAALESDHVSSNLHHWIDLTFGYKLSGVAAVKAKNVHLHLVDQHTHLTSQGAAQLFQQPHPQRRSAHTSSSSLLPRITRGLLNTQLLTYGMPESETDSQYADASFDSTELGRVNQAAIHLPRNYQPLAELEQCEALEEFKARALHVTAPNPSSVQPASHPKYQDDGITEDMVTLMCLTCEMFMDAKLRMQDSQPPLWKRVSTIERLCLPHLSAIQRPLQKFVWDMFQSLKVTEDKRMYFEAIFPDGSPPPTPGFLIQPYSDLIPFPHYFGELYTCLNKIEEKTWQIQLLKKKRMSAQERASNMKQLEREKVPLLGTFLWKYQSYLGSEGMGIVLPYIQDLLQNEYTTVQAAWSLFDSTTRELGPLDSVKQFLPFLTSLFSGEVSSAKHIKLYHRSFLMQLIVRLGLETFLTYFSTLLVEAVAGYKDFNVSSRFHAEELLEELDQQTVLKPAPGKSQSGVWPGAEFAASHDYRDDVVDADDADTVDGVDVDNGEKNESGELVDELSLDGVDVLLDDDALDSDRKISQGDASERDSLGSESSDDRIEETIIKRRVLLSDDHDGGAYDNLDQHSIHSISHIVSKNMAGSPSALDDLETFEAAFHETETLVEGSPLSAGKASESLFSETHSPSSKPSQSDLAVGGGDGDIDRLAGGETSGCNHSAVSTVEPVAEVTDEQTRRQPKLHELNLSQENAADVSVVNVHPSHLDSVLENSSEENYEASQVKASQQNLHDAVDDKQQRDMSDSSSLDDQVDAKTVISSSSEYQSRSQRTGSDMVRSETEDIMVSLSSDSSGHITNIRDVAADSVKWLSHKLGPVLATKFLSRNLVRMLALCYLGQDQLQVIEQTGGKVTKTSRLVLGDKNSQKVLECLEFTVVLYGEQVVLIQCLTSILDMIKMAQKRLSPRCEGGLIASVVLLSFLIPYLSDTNLMNLLEDSIISKCISPVLSIITSSSISFPCGSLARFVLCHKLIDLLYILGLRLGLEMSRKYLTSSMLQLFDTFSLVHGGPCPSLESVPMEPSLEPGSYGSEESYLTINMDPLTHQYKIGSPINLRSLKSSPRRSLSKIHSLSSVGIIDDKDDYMDPRSPSSTAEKCAQELRSVFCPELALACYIPLCRIFGSIHMEENLHNEDLIRRLCSQHDSETDLTAPAAHQAPASSLPPAHHVDDLLTPTEERSVTGGIGSNVTLVGNRIQLNEMTECSPSTQSQVGQFGRGYRHSGILNIHVDDLRSTDMEQNKSRHLRGHWLAYWERELGLHERDTMFNFMQIDLQTYLGHTSSIRSLYSMDTENCFISACKDKTVRLWSINSNGDGMNKQHCQYCYSRHKKSVFSVAYVESMRLVASCDSTVHLWDPFTGVAMNQLESPKYAPVVALTALPAPSTLVAMATTEATLRFLDLRTSKYTHEFRCSVGSSGLIRCVVVSPDSNWVAIGFSTGLIYILDVNSGMFLHYWKAHDAEILQLKAYNKSRLLSSAFDQTIKLWNVDTGQEACPTKSQAESVHCLSIYRDQLLTATTANRISVYASVNDSTAFASSKLKSFKGVVTCMSVLPLNKALLLGADNGTIRLMA